MKPVGGFFELEVNNGKNSYHNNALALNTGRACLNYILQQTKPDKVYIPYYTCDTVLEPINLNNTIFEYYSIDEYLNPDDIVIGENEYFYFINYFGIKSGIISTLVKKYGKNLIVDNSQGFFEKKYKDIWSFNSARKFFGVPDGAYLYSPISLKNDFQINKKIKYNHLINRLLGNQELAYKQYNINESRLNSEIKLISLFSKNILGYIDYEMVGNKRKNNFQYLSKNLNKKNTLNIPGNYKSAPICYPFFPNDDIDRKIFLENNIFIPTYWKRTEYIIERGFDFEKDLAEKLLPLPIDHRYDEKDLKRIVDLINK